MIKEIKKKASHFEKETDVPSGLADRLTPLQLRKTRSRSIPNYVIAQTHRRSFISPYVVIAEQGRLLSEAGLPSGEHSRSLRGIRRRAAHCARQGAHRKGLSPRY